MINVGKVIEKAIEFVCKPRYTEHTTVYSLVYCTDITQGGQLGWSYCLHRLDIINGLQNPQNFSGCDLIIHIFKHYGNHSSNWETKSLVFL